MIKNIFNRIFIFIFCLLLFAFCSFYTPQLSQAYFEENFNGSFDNPSSWVIDHIVTPSFSGSTIDLSAPFGNSFPYIRSSSAIISPSDDIIEFKFKYLSSGSNFGDGIAITDVSPPLDTVMLYPSIFSQYTMFYVWQGPGNPYLHIVTFLCPSINPTCLSGTPTLIYQTLSQDFSDHVIKVTKSGSSYSLFLDGINYFNSAPTTRVASNVWFGHPETTGSFGSWASFSIDYLKIGLPVSSPLPSPSPSLGPSPSPSVAPSVSPSPSIPPAPSGFPYYSQSNPLWGSQIYDDAQQWAAVGKRGIDRWGCALASAAMILKNYGVKAVSGIETTPAVLNAWLRIQPDGYLSNGLLNWLSISRYTHLSRQAGKSPTELEFNKKVFNQTEVDQSLTAGKAPILGTPGHFVVAYANQGTLYGIKDPANTGHTSLPKSDPIVTSNTFIPSLTDLSYMLYAYDPDMTITLKDSTGSVVTGLFTEEYLKDDVSGAEGQHLELLYVPKPATGDYVLEVSNPSDDTAKLDMYFYDTNGQVWTQKISIHEETDTQFDLRYDRTKVNKNKMEHNWQWIWRYVKKSKRWERVWNWNFWDHHNWWDWRD